MSAINYSKWGNIEVSDDEDDTHPNIDTPSLFRWRHQARLERDAQWQEERAGFQKEYKAFLKKLETSQNALSKAEKEGNQTKIDEIKGEIEALKIEEIKINQRKTEIEKKERLRPLNVDSMSHDAKNKTVINKSCDKAESNISEGDQIEKMRDFVKKNDDLIKKYAMFRKPDDTLNFLLENPHLVCEETANKLVLRCVDLAVEEKFGLMEHMAHQCIVMQFMLELAKSLKIDPRNVIRPFFAKFKSPEPEYQAAFNDELNAFKERVRNRAKARIEEAMAELEKEEREKRLGPGGLDPVEVFESLPVEMRECFESKNIEKLQEVIATMDIETAKYHMERCVASGMWVPDANKSEETYESIEDELDDATVQQ